MVGDVTGDSDLMVCKESSVRLKMDAGPHRANGVQKVHSVTNGANQTLFTHHLKAAVAHCCWPARLSDLSEIIYPPRHECDKTLPRLGVEQMKISFLNDLDALGDVRASYQEVLPHKQCPIWGHFWISTC